MANENIALQLQGIDTATPIRQAQQDEQTQMMNSERILREHYTTMDEREKSRLTSTIAGAAQLKTFLDRDDTEGAYNFLVQRKNSLSGRMAGGENIDTQETDAAINLLRSGQIDELKNSVNGLMAAGTIYGLVDHPDAPANIQEWQKYQQMTPEQQKEYLQMKRANQTVNTGTEQVVLGPDGQPVNRLPIQVSPDQQPALKGEQAQATEIGKAAGIKQAANSAAEFNSEVIRNYVGKALTLLPKATGGLAGQAVKGAAGAAGISTDASKADRQLGIISAKLVGMVPRFEGPQGVLDVELYKEAAGDLANTSLPTGDRMAAAQLMVDLIDEYGATGAGGTAGATGKKITVVGPDGEYEIDESDLADAQAEGYKVK